MYHIKVAWHLSGPLQSLTLTNLFSLLRHFCCPWALFYPNLWSSLPCLRTRSKESQQQTTRTAYTCKNNTHGPNSAYVLKFPDVRMKIHSPLKETDVRVSSPETPVLIKEKIVLRWNKSLVLLPNNQFMSTDLKHNNPWVVLRSITRHKSSNK